MLLAGTDPATLDDPEALLAAGRVRAWWDFSDRHRRRRHHRPRPGGAARHAGEPPDPGHARQPLDRGGARLAPRAAALRRHPFPRGRPGRLRLGDRLRRPIPADMPSGVYGVRLRGPRAAAEDIIPFYVLPPKGAGAGADRLPRQHLHLPGLCQPPARQPGRRLPPAHRRLGRLSAQPGRAFGIRPQHLQHPSRRQRHRLQHAAAADPDHAAGLPDLRRRPRLRPPAFPGRQPHHRLAGGEGLRLRRHHRRGPRCRGAAAAGAATRRW